MKLFSWRHRTQRKHNNVELKNFQAGDSALHFVLGSIDVHHYNGELTQKTLSEDGRINEELEIMRPISGNCSDGDGSSGNDLKLYRERIGVVFRNEQFGLLAIGTFGFNAFGGEPEIESLQVKQMMTGEQPDDVQLVQMEQLEGTVHDVFGSATRSYCTVNDEDAEKPMACFCPEALDKGVDNTVILNISKPSIEEEDIAGNSTPSKGELAKVIGWQGGSKVYPSSVLANDSIALHQAPNLAYRSSKQKMAERFWKQFKLLGSCFSRNVNVQEHNIGKMHKEQYQLPGRKTLSYRLKTVILPNNGSAALSIQSNSKTKGKESTPRQNNQKSKFSSVNVDEDPDPAALVLKDPMRQPRPLASLRNSLPWRQLEMQQKSANAYENWIKTDSEYVVLECM